MPPAKIRCSLPHPSHLGVIIGIVLRHDGWGVGRYLLHRDHGARGLALVTDEGLVLDVGGLFLQLPASLDKVRHAPDELGTLGWHPEREHQFLVPGIQHLVDPFDWVRPQDRIIVGKLVQLVLGCRGLRVESSSTGDPRLRGALPNSDIGETIRSPPRHALKTPPRSRDQAFRRS